MTKFRKIIFHAGLQKTGTSTIQKYLAKQIDSLYTMHKLVYPVLLDDPRPFKENHSIWLTSLFASDGYNRPVNISFGYNTPEKLKVKNNDTLTKLNQIFDSKSYEDVLLISAEGTSTIDINGIKAAFDWLKTLGKEFQFVACLRHPVLGLSSEFQQKLKTGKTLEELFKNTKVNLARNLFNVARESLPKENIFLYDFFDAINHAKGITGKFFDVINVDHSIEDLKIESVNQSMSMEGAILFSALNFIRPKFNNGAMGGRRFSRDVQFFMDLGGAKFKIPRFHLDKLLPSIEANVNWLDKKMGFRFSQSPDLYEDTSLSINPDLEKIQEISGYKLSEMYEAFNLQLSLLEENKTTNNNPILKQIVLNISDELNRLEIANLKARLTADQIKKNPEKRLLLERQLNNLVN